MVPTRQHHPDTAALERFVRGELSPVERQWIELHLESCPECEWQVDELGVEEDLDGLLPPFDPGEYDQAFDRVLSNAKGWLPDLFREVDSSTAQFSELLQQSPRERWARVLEEERFHTIKLCQLLMDQSRESWFTAPSAALDLAGLAVGIARSLDASRYGSLLKDIRARAWAYLGNAYRILADYTRAEASFRESQEHLELSVDPSVRGEIFGLMGSLANSRDRQEESLEHCDRALVVYREIEDQRNEARLLISKGLALDDSCRYEEAIQVLRQGLLKINREDEPFLWLGIQHNLIRTMDHMRQYEDAWKVLKETEQEYREAGGSILLKGFWAKALVASHLGKLNEAGSLLLDVRESFAGLGGASEVAHVSLDLAVVYARQGRSSECKTTVSEAIPLFESLGLRADAFAARLLYERAGGKG